MGIRLGLLAALLVSTAVVAQEIQNNPTAPSNPAAPHTPLIQNQVECWDAANNRARNPETANTNTESQRQSITPSAQASPSITRPPGMRAC
jgi:hypothetical protein